MKKKIPVPMLVLLVHLLICILLSLDWFFLEGAYLGFTATFLIIWGLTVPAITAGISCASAVIQVKKKEKMSIPEIITAVVGGGILLIYLASACGLLQQFALISFYLFVFAGTLFIWICWGYQKIKKNFRR